MTASDTNRSLSCVVTLTSPEESQVRPALQRVRQIAQALPAASIQLAGPAAAQADLQTVILLLVFRSVLLPLVVIASGVVALALCSAVLYVLGRSGAVMVDGQVQGILSVLVIGATTDYGLLLLSRYDEHIPTMPTRSAMASALKASWAPITASAATVACAMGALLFSALPSNRVLAPAGAIAMACSLLAALTLVPCAVLLGPRAVFWPRKPNSGGQAGRFWRRVADMVGRRSRTVWVVGFAALAGCAALAALLSPSGLPLGQALGAQAPSVRAQAALQTRFPAGTGSPAIVLVAADHAEQLRRRLDVTEGVARTETGPAPASSVGRAAIFATFDSVADSERAQRTVERVRALAGADRGSHAEVGGHPAQVYDAQEAAERDRIRVLPAVLVIVLLLLVVLLRSLALPVVLVGVVVANFMAALGTSAMIFQLLFSSTATEPSLVLFSFVFLIALGVDYNIFLIHRIRQESLRAGPRRGTLEGLRVTGNVISSAGVVLATTFAALTVMPLRYLVQIGIIVAVGVLLDTLLVRPFLLPALLLDAGPRLWWPTTLAADNHHQSDLNERQVSDMAAV
ncbi:MMPL family transporter [Streptomyces sp. NPDC059759]|uniref:MMPL family transporter n=1 Tax=Streptomyces sp. NPDC059759 TaxID=3346936 RepID=UPI003669D3E9